MSEDMSSEKKQPTEAELKYQKLQEIVSTVMMESIEELVFYEVQPVQDNAEFSEAIDWLALSWKHVSIHVLKPFFGEVKLIMPEGLAQLFAQEIFLVEDESELEESVVRDVMLEIINVITGRLMAYLKPNEIFKINLPEFAEEEETDGLSFDFSIKGMPIWLVLIGESFVDEVTVDDACV